MNHLAPVFFKTRERHSLSGQSRVVMSGAAMVMREQDHFIAPYLPAGLNSVGIIALTTKPWANCHRYGYLPGVDNVH
ncbi:MAG: hypothetical protein KGL58_02520 [Pseudomonadota bacterium]|nr:hypothetical protein [Pseudomonadota bacterium]